MVSLAEGTRLFDYPRWAEPFRDELRGHAERVAKEHGLVHIFSAMEPCASFRPWHDKTTGRTFLKPTEGKCLHYYFYFIDPELGLCYLRVPTWAPFRLQFYCNGHFALARQLDRARMSHVLLRQRLRGDADFPAPKPWPTPFPYGASTSCPTASPGRTAPWCAASAPAITGDLRVRRTPPARRARCASSGRGSRPLAIEVRAPELRGRPSDRVGVTDP